MKIFIKIILGLFLFQSVLFAAGKPYSQAEFDKLNKEGKPIILHIHAKWCSTCAAQDPILNSLMKTPEFKNFTFYNVDFDTSKDLLKTLKVSRAAFISSETPVIASLRYSRNKESQLQSLSVQSNRQVEV